MIPLWLLDVDGVVNIVCGPDLPPGHRRFRLSVRGHHMTVVYRPAVIARLHAAHTLGLADVRWLTTWMDDAAELGRFLELPEFAVAGHAEYDAAHSNGETLRQWWKARTARRLCEAEPGRALVWTDDDLAYADRLGVELTWVPQGRAHLLLSPNPTLGLTDKHLDRIEAFLDAGGPHDG